jgi:hypothetical protein
MTVILMLTSGLLIASANEPDDGMYLGRVFLTLGMPREKVIAQLAEDYSLQQLEKTDIWHVLEKQSPPSVVGNLNFANDRLRFASKNLLSDANYNAVGAAAAIFDYLNAKVGEAETCRIGTSSTQTRNMGIDQVFIQCGGPTYLNLSLSRIETNPPLVRIKEVLAAPEDMKGGVR